MAGNKPELAAFGRAVALALVLGVGVTACSARDSSAAGCFGVDEEPLMYAATEERYLGLGAGALSSIVAIVNSMLTSESLCTGIRIHREWVLTAGHCVAIEPAEVLVSLGADAAHRRLAVLERRRHAEVDLGLFRVSSDDDGGVIAPLAPEADFELRAGDLVELAGYGVTETGSTHDLRFLVEPIVEVDAESVVVTGSGVSGACLGDSGGPALVRDSEGRVVVAGVLSSGSTSCLGEDRYVRVDTVADWIAETTGATVRETIECGGIDARGRCLYGNAVYCGGTSLVSEPCNGDRRCGWDRVARGFRCVLPADDPCGGVDAFGACEAGATLFCHDGRLSRTACSCGDVCRIHGASAEPRCVAP